MANKIARLRVREKQTGATAMVHGAELVSGFTRQMPKRGTRDLLDAFEASPMLQAICRKIAGAMASIQWQAFFLDRDGELVEQPGHIAAETLNKGVQGLDGYAAKFIEQVWIELVGESFAILERNGMRAPVRRWPVPPHWVRATPYPNETIFEFQPPGRQPFNAMREDVIWTKVPNAFDPYARGAGIGRALTDELNADEAAARHAASSLTNRARPDIVVSGSKETPLQKDDVDRISEIWRQRFGGPENTGRGFFSASPIEVTTLTPTFQELQLIKLREFERDILMTVFGIPPEIMGVIENSNRATIDSAEFLFSKLVIKPRLEMRASAYNDQLAPQYDERLVIGFEDPVQEDKEFRLKVMQANPSAFTIDEIRDLVDAGPMPEGATAATPVAAPEDQIEQRSHCSAVKP